MTTWTTQRIVAELKRLGNKKDALGMQRFGIRGELLGVSIYKLRPLAKQIGTNHQLALDLWKTGVHEARLLAVFLDDSEKVTEKQMDDWAKDFDSWDVCDQATTSLFDLTPLAYKKVSEWSGREEEFVKRAAFAMIAGLAVHDKKASDEKFIALLPIIEREAWDDRNFVKKAVNWALRNIGKRNATLNKAAIASAKRIQAQGTRSARWIASDALRELERRRF